MTVATDVLLLGLLELLELIELLALLELLESVLIGVPANVVQAFCHAVSIIVANAAYTPRFIKAVATVPAAAGYLGNVAGKVGFVKL